MNKFLQSVHAFAVEDDGAQIVEYALIIAMVSIALAGILATAFDTDATDGGMFQTFVNRVADCLAGTNTICLP